MSITNMDFCSASFIDSTDSSNRTDILCETPPFLRGELFETRFRTGSHHFLLDDFRISEPNSPLPIAENTELDAFAQSEKSISAGRSQKGTKRKHSTRDCEICTTSFSSLRMLGDHMLRVHNIKVFKCDNCEYESSRGDNVRVHQRKCKAVPNKGIGAPKRHRVSMKSLTKSPATTDLGTAPETLSSLNLEKGSKIHRRITHETTSGLGHSTNSESNITNRISRDILSLSPTDTQFNIRPVRSEISISDVDGDQLRELQDENKKLWKEVERLRKELKDSQFEASLWKRTSLELNSSHRGIA
ncbi:hypothetical protein TWF106_010220 [Orbilia oligospora]|uniref:C2H2-type domain-containing protein n=1 Tax=Orbilia oligospora TaxID=2813651 RepID=A0A7C8QFZ7_ORBOL|nr:hypothetical protein TWF106_010220 [Orbilia oligospora]